MTIRCDTLHSGTYEAMLPVRVSLTFTRQSDQSQLGPLEAEDDIEIVVLSLKSIDPITVTFRDYSRDNRGSSRSPYPEHRPRWASVRPACLWGPLPVASFPRVVSARSIRIWSP